MKRHENQGFFYLSYCVGLMVERVLHGGGRPATNPKARLFLGACLVQCLGYLYFETYNVIENKFDDTWDS